MFVLRSLYDHVGNIHWDGRRGLEWVDDETLASNSILINGYFEEKNSDFSETFLSKINSPDDKTKLLPNTCCMAKFDSGLVTSGLDASLTLLSTDGKQKRRVQNACNQYASAMKSTDSETLGQVHLQSIKTNNSSTTLI